MINTIFVILIIVIPIIAIWRWSFLGVFISTLANQTIITLWGILESLLSSQPTYHQGGYFNSEDWEFWKVSLVFIFLYCLFIYFVKCGTAVFYTILVRIKNSRSDE